MTPLDKIKQSIEENKSFVLQGGAGSGKTETLKEVLEYITENYPDKKVACITHTNLAVDEIKSRVGEQYTISTIHSFLNSIIKDYKKNISQCISELFKVKKIERKEIEFYEGDEKVQKKKEHEKYKKIYEKYAKKLFTIQSESIGKAIGKREYDKDPISYNFDLNTRIDELNEIIKSQIKEMNYNNIKYNETRFDSYNDLTFGHDGLLEISYQLFRTFPKIGKILQDRFDYVFIDEYQDANEKIIKVFLECLPETEKTVIGLFGDSMQSIYSDGIGDVQKYISIGLLNEIPKEDNYRCSVQVIDFINKIRNDGLRQEVALKHSEKSLDERQGTVNFYYSIVESKPNAFSSPEDKNEYIGKINTLINLANSTQANSKLLMLTNKSISVEAGFSKLYDTFAERYQEPKEYIEEVLIRLQFMDLIELCQSYKNGNYNYILSELKKVGYPIRTIEDKQKLKDDIEHLLGFDGSAIDALNYAFNNNLIKKSESFDSYMSRKDAFLSDLNNEDYQAFKSNYSSHNTLKKMRDSGIEIEEEEFKELEKELKKENFYLGLFSPTVTFNEIINYYNYMNEEIDYITMHKTKGSGIDNVIVVLDEYFWNEYDFTNLFDSSNNEAKKIDSQKLFYVACSRTKTNLTCVRLIKEDEETLLKQFYPDAINVSL
ncbi:DNA helicase [Malaciobacter halophilus]|uniref:DNA helicase n=1 Tax=Malaciobacter halophilus TaxID=197482 RepID=A0A2N1J611_9BACT|nr:UvrD-helicase domain-containing protein [Malaciobacter halophilus]AXH09555.1 UvrD/REP helicase domain-containing protein [Malaciobacter halophilus]PKI81983.1 DNA helicase [Malaciobacter halophilus]